MSDMENEILNEIRADVKKFLQFQGMITQKAEGFEEKFEKNDKEHKEMCADIGWIRGKILIFMGAVALIVWFLDKVLRAK